MSNPEISEAAKAKACELAASVAKSRGKDADTVSDWMLAFHMFIQTTSDVAKEARSIIVQESHSDYAIGFCKRLDELILPEPKDPLEEVLKVVFSDLGLWTGREADELRNEVEKRGGKITFD